jgi:hypothetical protein
MYSAEDFALPVNGQRVFFIKALEKMICMFFADILDTEIIDDETEADRSEKMLE